MNIEPTNLLKALKGQPTHEPKDIPTEKKVEAANELHDWIEKDRH